MSAPLAMRYFTISRRSPFSAATCRGVIWWKGDTTKVIQKSTNRLILHISEYSFQAWLCKQIVNAGPFLACLRMGLTRSSNRQYYVQCNYPMIMDSKILLPKVILICSQWYRTMSYTYPTIIFDTDISSLGNKAFYCVNMFSFNSQLQGIPLRKNNKYKKLDIMCFG